MHHLYEIAKFKIGLSFYCVGLDVFQNHDDFRTQLAMSSILFESADVYHWKNCKTLHSLAQHHEVLSIKYHIQNILILCNFTGLTEQFSKQLVDHPAGSD